MDIIKNKPLVSICIPTFNRHEYLEKSIKSIICQPEFQNGEVEIVVSDNASTDKTFEVMSKYTSQYKNISYSRNKENIGVYNYPLVISHGAGVLRKLSGDTMIYNGISLKYLCSIVEKYCNEKPQIFFLDRRRKCIEEESVFCNTLDSFAGNVSYWSTWLGSFSIWGDECHDVEKDTKGCELLLWHDRKVYDLVAQKGKAVICNKKITSVLDVQNKDISYGLYRVFYMYHLSILQKFVDSALLSNETFNGIRKDLLFNFFTPYIIKWEAKNMSLKFSDSENLIQAVFAAYEEEDYWSDYLKYYRKKKRSILVKQISKTVLKKIHIWDTLILLRNKSTGH